MNRSRRLVWLAAVAASLGALWVYLRHRDAAPEVVATAAPTREAAVPAAAPPGGATHTGAPPFGLTVDEELTAAEARFDELARALPAELRARLSTNSRLGQRIARFALFTRLGPVLDKADADRLRAAYLGDLRRHGREAIGEVKAFLSRLESGEYAEERIALFSVLTAVPDVDETMKELAYRELTALAPKPRPDGDTPGLTEEQRVEARSWGAANVLPLMAYNFFSVATRDQPGEALSGTLDALRSQRDAEIRKGIATAFVTAHPELKADLYHRLGRESIDVPEVEPVDKSQPAYVVEGEPQAGSFAVPQTE